MSTDLFDDEYDPLAPPNVVGETADDTSGELAGVAEGAEGEELGSVDDGGFGNSLVRIWFDDAGRLTRVRVSPVWFRKLAPQQSLEDHFHHAFRMSSLTVGPGAPPAPVVVDDQGIGAVPRRSADNIWAMVRELEDHQDRWEKSVAQVQAVPVAQRATGRSDGVRVTLDDAGHPHTVEFDQQWLDDAQVGSICTHVVAAAHKAHERHVPPSDDLHDETDRFRAEHEVLLARMHRMFNPRGQ